MDLAYDPLASDTYMTQTYTAGSFEQPPGVLSPPYSDHGVDTDGDGLFNAIAVDVPLAVRSSAAFTVIVNLYDASGMLGLASDSMSKNLDSGTPTLELEVPTLAMVESGVDGPYLVQVLLGAEDPNAGSTPTIGTDMAMSGTYTVDQFDGVPATLGPCSDQAIDRDTPPDGYYDVLAVNVTVNVTESGPYLVQGALIDSAMNFITYDDIYVPEGTGNFTVTLNFPGVDIRNDGVSGPFNVQVYLATYLNSNYVQIDYESYTTASYDAGDFAYAAPALLDGHLYDEASQAPLANTPIEAFNYHWLKEVFSVTDASGYYSFPVEEGPWVVTPEPYEYNDQAIAQVDVTGPETSLDFSLPTLVPQTAYVNLSLGDWSHAERDRSWIFSYMAATNRQYYDWWFGNRDGYMAAEEYNASLEWPGSVPPPLPSLSTDLFQVDGSAFELVPGSNHYTVGDIAGSVFDPRPMTGLETGSFAGPSAPGPGLIHTVEVNVSYDLSWNDRIYEISLPAGYVLRHYTAPSDFVVTGIGSENVTINPPLPEDPDDMTSFGWVTLVASIPDSVPPAISSVAASPNPVEIGSPTTISAVVADENMVQSVSVELHDSHGFSYGNFTMTGSGDTYTCDFTPTLTVPLAYTIWAEDGAGNFANATGTLDVVDTTPPVIVSYSAGPTPQEVGSAVTFHASVTDNGIIHGVYVEVHAPGGALAGNYSMTSYLDPQTRETSQVFTTPGTYTYTLWARDDANHYASASGTFVMRDTTAPSVTGTSATPSPVEIHGDVSLAATVTDVGGVASVNVEIRNAQNQVVGNYTMAHSSGNTYAYGFAPSTLGTYTYRITAMDSSGNVRSRRVRSRSTTRPLLRQAQVRTRPWSRGRP